jgi:NAD(P)-dependent dehydrogenase (short-subunit alcohol dehydrogenase family)
MGDARHGRIVVTGASTGIGRACAERFAELGYEVFAGVRSAADGEAVRASSPEHIRPVRLDVTDPASIAAALAAVGPEPLAGLVNNAGIAVAGPLELVPLEDLRRQFEVNVVGLVAVTRAFLPLLRQRPPGRIVNIGSVAGRSALPGSGAYDASKFAIEAITDVLRMELHPWGVAVAIIEPGAVATPIWRKALDGAEALSSRAPPERYGLYRDLMAEIVRDVSQSARKAIPVDAVARAVEHAITARRPRTRYPVGLDAHLWLLLNLLPDRWRDGLILGQLAKGAKRADARRS